MKNYTVLSTLRSFLAVSLVGFTFLSSVTFASFQKAANSCSVQLGGTPKVDVKYAPDTKGRIRVSDEIGALFIDTAAGQRNSTTGNRSELKRTVKVASLQEALRRLSKTFTLTQRDAVQPGTKNVTVTDYINILKFNYNGETLSVKIRFRKYGTIPEGKSNVLENVSIIPSLKEVSFLEFKIDHPDFENSVLKPRGLMADADIAKIGTPEFLKQFDQILGRALAQNSKSAESLETMAKMQNLLKKLHEEGVPLKKDSQTIYERTSYAIPVRNPTANKNYEIQVTIDEDILLYSYPHNVTVDAYKSDEPLTVVEVKIPVEMIDKDTKELKESMLSEIPLLGAIQVFIDDLTGFQVNGYDLNKGKQSLIKSLIEQRNQQKAQQGQ